MARGVGRPRRKLKVAPASARKSRLSFGQDMGWAVRQAESATASASRRIVIGRAEYRASLPSNSRIGGRRSLTDSHNGSLFPHESAVDDRPRTVRVARNPMPPGEAEI